MKNNLKIIGGVVICLVILVSVYLGGVKNRSEKNVFGDSVGNASQSTTTAPTTAGIPSNAIFPVTSTGFTRLACGPGSLASVIITKTSNATLGFYDGTTTDHRDRATTTLAEFNTTTAGEYPFNANFTLGLIVTSASSVGAASSTITFNGNPTCQ